MQRGERFRREGRGETLPAETSSEAENMLSPEMVTTLLPFLGPAAGVMSSRIGGWYIV